MKKTLSFKITKVSDKTVREVGKKVRTYGMKAAEKTTGDKIDFSSEMYDFGKEWKEGMEIQVTISSPQGNLKND